MVTTRNWKVPAKIYYGSVFKNFERIVHFYSNGDIAGSLCEQEYIHMFCERAIKICLE